MKCVILQPSYIPWRGYFDLIHKADTFVFYDDVQYDDRGWRNRNRVKSPFGTQWITVPVFSKGAQVRQIPICQISVNWDRDWASTHLKTLRQSYGKAPFFKQYEPMLSEWYAARPELLADFTIETTIRLARELGIHHTRFMRSSSMGVGGDKTDRLLNVLKAIGATHYISGPSAKAYLEEDKLAAEGISVEWMVYDYPAYPQLHPPYDPYVSTLDLLFMTGPEAGTYIWGTKRAGA